MRVHLKDFPPSFSLSVSPCDCLILCVNQLLFLALSGFFKYGRVVFDAKDCRRGYELETNHNAVQHYKMLRAQNMEMKQN